jgi:hypothetical protein
VRKAIELRWLVQQPYQVGSMIHLLQEITRPASRQFSVPLLGRNFERLRIVGLPGDNRNCIGVVTGIASELHRCSLLPSLLQPTAPNTPRRRGRDRSSARLLSRKERPVEMPFVPHRPRAASVQQVVARHLASFRI